MGVVVYLYMYIDRLFFGVLTAPQPRKDGESWRGEGRAETDEH